MVYSASPENGSFHSRGEEGGGGEGGKGSRPPLSEISGFAPVFKIFQIALNSSCRIFLNCAESCIFASLSLCHNFMNLNRLYRCYGKLFCHDDDHLLIHDRAFM